MSKTPLHTFEDWKQAAADYAAAHLDLWPFQVQEMASDFAWRMEGSNITEDSVQYAYNDWISGNNPYSVHTIILDGYDRKGQWAHDSRVACRKLVDLGVENGMDIRSAQRMADDIYKHYNDEVGIYKSGKYYQKWMKEWFTGENLHSPHRVPLDAVNLEERVIRQKEQEEKHKGSDSLMLMLNSYMVNLG